MSEEYKYDISIVIPVYNGEHCILNCLNSIYSIDWGGFTYEVIIVNDCSTDNTKEVLTNQVSFHKNLTVIHLPVNGKPGTARNIGIKSSQGRFIMFVDADDCIEPTVKSVLDYAVKSDIDMCHFGISTQYNMIEQVIPDRVIMDGRDFAEKFYDMSCDTGYFLSYLYSNRFLNIINHPFVEGRVHEDADWCEYHLWNCHSIAHINAVVYKNYANSASIMHSLSPQKDADNIMMCYRRFLFTDTIEDNESHFKSVILSHCKLWVSGVLSLRHLSRYDLKRIDAFYSRIEEKAIEYLRELDWVGFPSICLYHWRFARFIVSFINPIAAVARRFK